jgi:DNA-binding NarL/FixJ family response regulator
MQLMPQSFQPACRWVMVRRHRPGGRAAHPAPRARRTALGDRVPTALLIDDHPLLLEGLRAILEAAGVEVVGTAGTVDEGVAEYRRTEPDVVLLDLTLEERSGFDVVRELRRRGHAPRIVVVTMREDLQSATEAIRLGVLGYVLKGSPGAELVKATLAAARGDRNYPQDLLFRASESLLTQDQGSAVQSLSDRERQVLDLVVQGLTSAEIGQALHLSPKTVETYRSRLMAKLGVDDIASLVKLAIREGIARAE